MRTLIVPCAGNECIDGIPLILNRHPDDGMILAAKLLEGIFSDTYNRIIFTLSRDADNRFSISDTLKANIPDLEVIVLDERTSGPAETVYRTITLAGISGEFAVKDSHNRILIDEPARGNSIAGFDLMKHENVIENLRNKSFIVLNEQNDVLDIVEKRLRSDIMSAGLYCFRSSEDFISAYLRLSDPGYQIGRLYISHIISYLIGRNNMRFHCNNVSFFEDWAASSSWHNLRRKFSHKIKLIMTDLDGTLFDTGLVNYLAYREALSRYGFTLEQRYFMTHCTGRHYADFLSEICGTPEIIKAVHDLKKGLYQKYISHAKLNIALLNMLDILRSECRLALVTTASGKNTSEILSAFGLGNYFDLVITQEDISRNKPDPEGYIMAMKYFNVNPEECIIFEDSSIGIEAAKKSGASYFSVNLN